MKWAECLSGYRHLHCSEFKWKRLKLHAYLKREIWVTLHKCWISFFFFFFLRTQSTVLAPGGGTPFCPAPFFFIPRLIRGVKNSEGEAVFTIQTCMCYAYSWQAASLTFSPLPPEKTKRQRVPHVGCRVTQSVAVVWSGVMGTRGLPCRDGQDSKGRAGGTGAAWGEAGQALGGMSSSCSPPGSTETCGAFFAYLCLWMFNGRALKPWRAQAVTPFACFPAHPALEDWHYK